jgi:hypothetical protein
MRYVPRINGTYRWFDTADVEAIDDTIDSLQEALIDYVLIDLTNAIQVPFILKRARAFLKRLADRRASKTAVLQFAFGLGWFWSNDPATFEQQAQLAWDWFYNNATYGAPSSSVKGDQAKPLLVQYGTATGKVAWLNYTGNRTYSEKFDIKWSYGTTPTRDPEGLCPGMEPTPPPAGAVWLPPQKDWGLFYGWGFPNGTVRGFRQKLTPRGCHCGSHLLLCLKLEQACDQRHSSRVSNLPLTVTAVNCVTTLKVLCQTRRRWSCSQDGTILSGAWLNGKVVRTTHVIGNASMRQTHERLWLVHGTISVKTPAFNRATHPGCRQMAKKVGRALICTGT